MNSVLSETGDARSPALVDCVDFKWLMAGEGHRVDVDRLRVDAAYARQCLALAQVARSPLLRQVAQRLIAALQPAA